MKIAIIGAGPAGLAMAYELSKNNIHVDIYEKDKVVGGLAKSVWMWDTRVELGPHFIGENMNPHAKEFMSEIFASVKMHSYQRLTRIYLDNKFYNYPPDGLNIIKNNGILGSFKAFASFITKKSSESATAENVEDFVSATFGGYIFKKFFKEYTEKLWGLPPDKIDAVFVKNLIGFKGNSMLKKLMNMFTAKNTVTYKNSYYPDEGFSMLWELMQKRIEVNGGTFHFTANIKHIETPDPDTSLLAFEDGRKANYDYVISTIPENILIKLLPNVPPVILQEMSKIKFRSLLSVFLLLEHCSIIEDNAVYLYSKQVKAARITNFNRFRNVDGNNIVMLEYWTSEAESVWNYTDESIVEMAKNDLMQLSATKNVQVKDAKIFRLKNAYEIPETGYQDIKNESASFLKQFNRLFSAGRASQNNFNYGMGDAIADGYFKAKFLIDEINNYTKQI